MAVWVCWIWTVKKLSGNLLRATVKQSLTCNTTPCMHMCWRPAVTTVLLKFGTPMTCVSWEPAFLVVPPNQVATVPRHHNNKTLRQRLAKTGPSNFIKHPMPLCTVCLGDTTGRPCALGSVMVRCKCGTSFCKTTRRPRMLGLTTATTATATATATPQPRPLWLPRKLLHPTHRRENDLVAVFAHPNNFIVLKCFAWLGRPSC